MDNGVDKKMSDKKFNNKNLKEAIDNSRMTREQIADKVQCDTSSITKYYNGDRYPKTDVIIKLAKLFNVSTDYLLGVTDVATNDKDLQFVCDYTGFDERTITNLHNVKSVLEKEKNNNNIIENSIFINNESILEGHRGLTFYFKALSLIINNPKLTVEISNFYRTMGFYLFNDNFFKEHCNETINAFFTSPKERIDVAFYRICRIFNNTVENGFVDLFKKQFYYEFEQNAITNINNEVAIDNYLSENNLEIDDISKDIEIEYI